MAETAAHFVDQVLPEVPNGPSGSTQRQIAADLLKRAFDGSAKNLVLGALSAQPASPEELAEIQTMLEAFAKDKGRSK